MPAKITVLAGVALYFYEVTSAPAQVRNRYLSPLTLKLI